MGQSINQCPTTNTADNAKRNKKIFLAAKAGVPSGSFGFGPKGIDRRSSVVLVGPEPNNPLGKEVVQLSEQSNQRVSIRVARPEARRACESLGPSAKLPTPIATL